LFQEKTLYDLKRFQIKKNYRFEFDTDGRGDDGIWLCSLENI
jgi:hypothetical protein